VQERSIRIIIDNDSCNNLASTTLVEKLSLPTRKLSNPYHIQWLNDGGKIRVSRSVRVPFSIGAYSDYVDCDVVPMEACSLLLGSRVFLPLGTARYTAVTAVTAGVR
jgi:hypothetical protein